MLGICWVYVGYMLDICWVYPEYTRDKRMSALDPVVALTFASDYR